jgi:Flp pilus assembly protein protease CpaA
LLKIFDPAAAAVVVLGGAAGAIVDLRSRRVPNPLTAGIALVGVALALTHVTHLGLVAALEGCALGLVLMLPGHVIGATGAGDVKLFAAFGTLLGPTGILSAFIYTAIAGGAMAAAVAMSRRRLRITMERAVALVSTGGANVVEIEHPSENNRFAYAPAIVAGALIAAIGF